MTAKRLTAEAFNRFLYRQHVLKMQVSDVDVAKGWCMDLIRREHPEWDEAAAEAYYQELFNVRWKATDEWTRRNT